MCQYINKNNYKKYWTAVMSYHFKTVPYLQINSHYIATIEKGIPFAIIATLSQLHIDPCFYLGQCSDGLLGIRFAESLESCIIQVGKGLNQGRIQGGKGGIRPPSPYP